MNGKQEKKWRKQKLDELKRKQVDSKKIYHLFKKMKEKEQMKRRRCKNEDTVKEGTKKEKCMKKNIGK